MSKTAVSFFFLVRRFSWRKCFSYLQRIFKLKQAHFILLLKQFENARIFVTTSKYWLRGLTLHLHIHLETWIVGYLFRAHSLNRIEDKEILLQTFAYSLNYSHLLLLGMIWCVSGPEHALHEKKIFQVMKTRMQKLSPSSVKVSPFKYYSQFKSKFNCIQLTPVHYYKLVWIIISAHGFLYLLLKNLSCVRTFSRSDAWSASLRKKLHFLSAKSRILFAHVDREEKRIDIYINRLWRQFSSIHNTLM